MIYLGNGIYSESGPDTLAHYGVIGMKWGIHKARIHEKNLYRYNRANGMSRADAKAQYKSRMAGVKSYARKNLRTGMKARDIATNSYNKANKTIANYDNLRKSQKRRKIIGGALGAAALGAAGYGAYRYAKGKKQLGTASKNYSTAFNAYKKSGLADSIKERAEKRGNMNLAEKAAKYAGRTSATGDVALAKGLSNTFFGSINKGVGKKLAIGGAAGLAATAGAVTAAGKLHQKKALRKKHED